MLNKCPKWNSCGAYNPGWTDAAMPEAVGVATNVTIYLVDETSCKGWTYNSSLEVIRCSRDTDHDVVYRFIGAHNDLCFAAFCGMQ